MKLLVDISKQLNDRTLAVRFEIDGTTLGILGASGCGKSMLLKCIAGVETPDSGHIQLGERIFFDHQLGINLSPQKRKVGLLFQQYALFPHLTVYKNLASVTKNQAFIEELLQLFHLENVAKSYPRQLSGGQKQRAAFARMLAGEPDLWLLDEPFSALDTSLKEELQIELQKRLLDFNGNTLIVSHSLDELYRLCPELVIMTEKDTIVGQTEALFKQPQTATAARLTGCKNVFSMTRLDAHHVHVTGWTTPLTVSINVPMNSRYIGIRAHDFSVEKTGINQIEVAYVRKQLTPFEQNAWFRHGQETIWWKGSKQVAAPHITQFSIDPEAIMVLT